MADTRRSILHTIRDQAKLLHSSTHSQQHPYLQVWTPQQWWESFQFLFINHLPPPDSAHHDDLLFFSKSPSHPTASNPPFFVRRKAKQLPEELQLSGSQFSHVDWAQTVLLNIVLQSQYQLTVVACGREALPFVAEGRTWSPNMITVSKPVYASTTVTAVNLDSSRAEASNPQPCYPDICFAVDNFDNAFQDLVLEDADKCYCVVLHAVLDSYEQAADHHYPDLAAAHASSSRQASSINASGSSEQLQQPHHQRDNAAGGHAAALAAVASAAADSAAAAAAAAVASAGGAPASPGRPPGAAAAAAASSRDNSGGGASTGSPLSWQIGTQRRTLFAGYVSYAQILDFMDSSARSRTLLDALMGSKAGQQDKVVMTGPGGVGRCEVAVKKVQDSSREQGSRSSSFSAAGGSSHGGSAAAAGAAGAAARAGSSHSNGSSSGGASKQALGSSGGGSSGEQQAPAAAPHPQQQQQQQQRGLLQRGLQRARMLAGGMQQVLSDINSGGGGCNMNCALMLLKLPVSYLARELLDAA